MKKVAVVAGGNSGEYEVSLNSAEMVMKTLTGGKFEVYKVIIRGSEWNVHHNKKTYPIDKNDFSFTLNRKKIKFDCAYIIVHGTPGEDGKLQGYFELLNIPYTSPDVIVSALTMNKYLTKLICKESKIKVAKSVLVHAKDEMINVDKIASKLGLPCFIKPNNGGSSVATTKAYSKKEMVEGIEAAFEHDSEVVIEEFIKGAEVTCGVFFNGKEVVALPITEIVPHNDFFDYDAKYKGQSDEITPARLSDKLTKKIHKLTKKVYETLRIQGMVRVDFIIRDNKPYFMEVNTVPGFSQASIVPQQLRAANLKEKDVLELLIRQAIDRKK